MTGTASPIGIHQTVLPLMSAALDSFSADGQVIGAFRGSMIAAAAAAGDATDELGDVDPEGVLLELAAAARCEQEGDSGHTGGEHRPLEGRATGCHPGSFVVVAPPERRE